MKIIIGSDKSGYYLKEAVKSFLLEEGHEVHDVGTTDVNNPQGYFIVAPKLAQEIAAGRYERGILCCGTGMGMAIAANKYKGVYASVVESVYGAKMCRAVNNANVLCMGGWLIADWLGIEMTKTFLSTEFTEELDDRREWLRHAEMEIKSLEDGIYG